MKGAFLYFALLGVACAIEFGCNNIPRGKIEDSRNTIGLTLSDTTYTPGKNFTVEVESAEPIQHLAIQAQDLRGYVWGRWEPQEWSRKRICMMDDNLFDGVMLVNARPVNQTKLVLHWIAPTEFYSDVRFKVTTMFDDDTYQTSTSAMIRSSEVRITKPSDIDVKYQGPDCAIVLEVKNNMQVIVENECSGGSTIYTSVLTLMILCFYVLF